MGILKALRAWKQSRRKTQPAEKEQCKPDDRELQYRIETRGQAPAEERAAGPPPAPQSGGNGGKDTETKPPPGESGPDAPQPPSAGKGKRECTWSIVGEEKLLGGTGTGTLEQALAQIERLGKTAGIVGVTLNLHEDIVLDHTCILNHPTTISGVCTMRRAPGFGGPLLETCNLAALRGVTLDGAGVPAAGPLVKVRQGTLAVLDARLTDNHSRADGGAVLADAGAQGGGDISVILSSGAVIERCSSQGRGGAVFLNAPQAPGGRGAELTIGAARLTRNRAASGGAVYAAGKNAAVTAEDPEGLLEENEAVNGNGGAICAEHVERLMVDGAVFARNRAPRGCGGAIYAAGDGAVRLTEQKPVEFCENHANVGGAVFLAGNRPAQATQNRPGRMLFSGNTARTQGNAIYVCGGAGGPFEK